MSLLPIAATRIGQRQGTWGQQSSNFGTAQLLDCCPQISIYKVSQVSSKTVRNYFQAISLLTLILLVTGSHSYAQQRSCGMWNPDQQERLSPEQRHLYNLKREAFQQKKGTFRRSNNCSNPIQLPIAIHFQEIINPDLVCLRALAEDQVNILNRDLQGNNADTLLWQAQTSSFPNTFQGNTCIELVLANKNHPNGFGLSDGDVAVTINQTSGDYVPAWSGYVNIVVRNIIDLGYAPLGGAGNGDAINVDDNAFGTFSCGQVIPQAPYHLGRTVVHELGHYLYLNHIWANEFDTGGCAFDDGITDTPTTDGPHYGCPSLGASCGSNDLHMNYLDYVNDACMYMFTEGQAQVMEQWAATNLQPLIANVNNVYVSSVCHDCTPVGCTDVDQDGYCAEVDCDDSDNSIPAASGTACNDNNPNTYNDVIQMDGCTCLGITNDCLQEGGDSDSDGICDDLDCRPLDACYPKPVGTACDDGYSQTQQDQIQSGGCTCLGIGNVQAKLYLEGFYDVQSQGMQLNLNNQNLLPLVQPYQQSPWNYNGSEQVTTIPADAVDWVLVMARDSNEMILSQSAGFINSQGQLMGIDGSLGIDLLGAYGNFISIHHRNHLAVVSANIYEGALDLTSSISSVKGIQQLKNVGGVYCLYAGDYDASGIVNNLDYNKWANKKSLLNQYLTEDGDGNGIINNLDYNLWIGNGAKIGHEGIHY